MRPSVAGTAPLKLALKIDVDTFRGTRDGVPRLVEILRRHEASATFFFAMGPDHSGLYGKALPAPDVGRRCADVMRAARDAGHEIGLRAWDSASWRRTAAGADAEWTAREMARAMARFEEVFGERATVHGAAGWQMNRHAYRNTQALGFDYASDTRGSHPFVPVVRGELVACPQFPTTLPTLDELVGTDGASAEDGVARLLERTAADPHYEVFTLRAELEGMKLAPAFEKALEGWKAQGYALVCMREIVRDLAGNTLALHAVTEGTIPGRAGPVALQGPEFLAESGPKAA